MDRSLHFLRWVFDFRYDFDGKLRSWPGDFNFHALFPEIPL